MDEINVKYKIAKIIIFVVDDQNQDDKGCILDYIADE